MLFGIAFVVTVFVSLNAYCSAQKDLRGDVTMKVSPNIAQVNLGKNDLSLGQRLAVYHQECHGGRFAVCTKSRVGGARVTRVFDKKYSEVAVDPGVHFDVGYVVEKE